MKKYDFDEVIDRRGTQSYKWDIAERHMGAEDVLGMWTADMDFRCPPAMLETLQKRLDHGILGYTIKGPDYFSIVEKWMKDRYEWELTDDEICNCPPGVIPACYMLIDLLTEPGDPVFTFMPNYDSLYEGADNRGRRLVTAPLLHDPGKPGDWRLNLPAFERIIEEEHVRLAIMCSPHNPVGRVWTRRELEDFAEICIKHDVFVISDEVHCDLIRPGLRHTPLATVPGMADRSAVLMSINKGFNVAGLMTASIIIPNQDVMGRFRKTLSRWSMTLDGVFGALAFESVYSDPECLNWLEQVNEYLSANLEYAASCINEKVKGVTTFVPEGTYLMWLDFSETGLSGDQLREYLVKECRLDFCDGWEFDPACRDHMRLNAACPRATLEEAMGRLEKGMARL